MLILRYCNKLFASAYLLGIVLKLENFLTTSDEEIIAISNYFKPLRYKLKLLQNSWESNQKGSRNWLKFQRKIAIVYEKINNTPKDFYYKLAHNFCEEVGMIFIEDIDLESSPDNNLSKFIDILSWICWKRGVYFVKVNANHASQVCPECNARVLKKLNMRIHKCPVCRYTTSRDITTAQVILKRGLEVTPR
jgi:putative transposase